MQNFGETVVGRKNSSFVLLSFILLACRCLISEAGRGGKTVFLFCCREVGEKKKILEGGKHIEAGIGFFCASKIHSLALTLCGVLLRM